MNTLISNINELEDIINTLKSKKFKTKGLRPLHDSVCKDLTRNINLILNKKKLLENKNYSKETINSINKAIEMEIKSINKFLLEKYEYAIKRKK